MSSTRSKAGCSARSGAHTGANCLRLTRKSIVSLLTAGENTTLLLVVGHTDCRQSGGGVMHCTFVVNFMYWNCGVYDGWLDGFCFPSSIKCPGAQIEICGYSSLSGRGVTYPFAQLVELFRAHGDACVRQPLRERLHDSRV